MENIIDSVLETIPPFGQIIFLFSGYLGVGIAIFVVGATLVWALYALFIFNRNVLWERELKYGEFTGDEKTTFGAFAQRLKVRGFAELFIRGRNGSIQIRARRSTLTPNRVTVAYIRPSTAGHWHRVTVNMSMFQNVPETKAYLETAKKVVVGMVDKQAHENSYR